MLEPIWTNHGHVCNLMSDDLCLWHLSLNTFAWGLYMLSCAPLIASSKCSSLAFFSTLLIFKFHLCISALLPCICMYTMYA